MKWQNSSPVEKITFLNESDELGLEIEQTKMRQERPDNIEDRFLQAELEVKRLTDALDDLRQQWESQREQKQGGLKEDYNALKQAVLDYVVACGSVDVQVAMLRARGDVGGDTTEVLRRSLEEQANTFHQLKAMTRTWQGLDRP